MQTISEAVGELSRGITIAARPLKKLREIARRDGVGVRGDPGADPLDQGLWNFRPTFHSLIMARGAEMPRVGFVAPDQFAPVTMAFTRWKHTEHQLEMSRSKAVPGPLP